MSNNRQNKTTIGSHRRTRTDTSFLPQPHLPSHYHSTQTKPLLPKNKTQISHLLSSVCTPTHSRKNSIRRSPNCSTMFRYNKWYIKPAVRMKKSLARDSNYEDKDLEFQYNRLYQQKKLMTDFPFRAIPNQKLQLVNKIPIQNLRLLQGFKRNQQSHKKRVPKIIDLLLTKKQFPKFHP